MTTTLTIDGHNIRKIVGAAEFASRDTSLPMLNTVQITGRDGQVLAYATDRYTLAEATLTEIEVEGDTEFSAVIPLEAVKKWKTATTRQTERDRFHRLTLDGERWTLTDHLGGTSSGHLIAGDYPAVQNLMGDGHTLHPLEAPTLDADYLARLAKYDTATSRKRSRAWTIGSTKRGENRPILALAPDVRVLLMPIRLEEIPAGYTVEEN